MWLVLLMPAKAYLLYSAIRKNRPDEWAAHSASKAGLMSACIWIASVIFGRVRLDITNDIYRRRLSGCRQWLVGSLLWGVTGLGMLAWAAAG
jgi:hypothetical protein